MTREVPPDEGGSLKLLTLAWPVLISTWALMAFSVIDSVMTGHASATELAALALGNSVYNSVSLAMIGVLFALNPIFAQHFGADRSALLSRHFSQALWLALALSGLGALVLVFPSLWIGLAALTPELQNQVEHYLLALACALPATLLFRAVYALATAVSRPRLVMSINVAGVALKVPLNYVLVYGKWGLPAFGATGCGIATAVVLWLCCLCGFALVHAGAVHPAVTMRFGRPNRILLFEQLRLGIPSGLSYLIEVTSFTFMTILVARLGAEITAAHQIAANVTMLSYSFPLALAVATSTLSAQELGRGRPEAARRVVRRGLLLSLLFALATIGGIATCRAGIVALYTDDPGVARVAAVLLGYLFAFHVADALQTVATNALRAYKRALAPVLIYGLCLWGIGLGGGYLLAFRQVGRFAPSGASGLWLASAVSLWIAAAALLVHLARVTSARATPSGNAHGST